MKGYTFPSRPIIANPSVKVYKNKYLGRKNHLLKNAPREENEIISEKILFCLQLINQERAAMGHCHHLKTKQPIYKSYRPYLRIQFLFSNYIACPVNKRDVFIICRSDQFKT